MSITKSSVREYIVAMCDSRRTAVQKEIDAFYKAYLRPTVDDRIKNLTGRVPEWATYIHDKLDAKREAIEKLLKHNPNNSGTSYAVYRISDANTLSQMVEDMHRNCMGNIKRLIESPSDGYWDFGWDPLNELVAKLQKDPELRYMLDRLKGINALVKQLTDLIDKTANSGKQAFDIMVAHGVDMSGYKEPQKNLPAIVSLTADVCLINGTC